MNENVRAELGRAAEEFWLHAPWQTLTDEEHFGIRDAQTEMYGVSRRQRTSEIDRDEFAYRTDLILLSFNHSGEVPKAKRKGPLALAPIIRGGTRIIPTAFRKPPRLAARPLDDKEAVFLTRAAQLVVQLLESQRLGGLRLRNPKEWLVFVLGAETGAPVSEELRKLEETQPPARAPFVVPSGSRARLIYHQGARHFRGLLGPLRVSASRAKRLARCSCSMLMTTSSSSRTPSAARTRFPRRLTT
jgi:hypothetical protein